MNDVAIMLGIAAEVTGMTLSEASATAILAELASYPQRNVCKAIERCMRELRGRITLADILERIFDYPTPDEAWAHCPRSEADTVIWTTEAAAAYGCAASLIDAGDLVAARRAFIDAYSSHVREAVRNRKPPKYTISLGYDKTMRRDVISRAIEDGLLPRSIANSFPDLALPAYDDKPAITGPPNATAAMVAVGDIVHSPDDDGDCFE